VKNLKQKVGRCRRKRSKAKSDKSESNGPDPSMMLPPVHRADCCAQRDRGNGPNDVNNGFDRFDHLLCDLFDSCGAADETHDDEKQAPPSSQTNKTGSLS
jgi:hypothetical protein